MPSKKVQQRNKIGRWCRATAFFLPVFVARPNLHLQAVLLEVHFKGDFADNGTVLLDYFIDVNSMDLYCIQ